MADSTKATSSTVTSGPHGGHVPTTSVSPPVSSTANIGPSFAVQPTTAPASATPAPGSVQAPSRGSTNQTVSQIPVVRS